MHDPVLAPDGRTWRVRRQWVPRLGQETLWGRFHRRFRQIFKTMGENADPGCGEALFEGLLVGIVLLLLAFIGVPFLVALLDVLLLLVLAALALIARVLFRRPWIVEATPEGGTPITWRVSGLRESGRLVTEIEAAVRAGLTLPPLGPG